MLLIFLRPKCSLMDYSIRKCLYGATLWAGAPNYLKNKVQHLQLEACRVAIGPQSLRWSKKKLLDKMKWSNLQQLLVRASAITTHSIIHMKEPAVLAALMCPIAPSLADATSPAQDINPDTCYITSQIPVTNSRSPNPTKSPAAITNTRTPIPGPTKTGIQHQYSDRRITRITGPDRLGPRPRNVGTHCTHSLPLQSCSLQDIWRNSSRDNKHKIKRSF